VTHTRQDLLNALMEAPRFGYRPPPHPLFHSLLRASAPPKPVGRTAPAPAAQPPRLCVRRRTSPPAASEGHAVAPEVGTAVPTLAEVERLGGISMQLDIAVERRRSFWWRLVAKLQFFRS
jgi:hypothetical protein